MAKYSSILDANCGEKVQKKVEKNVGTSDYLRYERVGRTESEQYVGPIWLN